MMTKGIYIQLVCPKNRKYSIIIEDNERVCYAYLVEDKVVVGDVWLYNRDNAPHTVEWKKENMPFLNPAVFIDPEREIAPISNSNQVEIEWRMQDSDLEEVQIKIKKELIAKMTTGSKPGWSTIVKTDGPLAKTMKTADAQYKNNRK